MNLVNISMVTIMQSWEVNPKSVQLAFTKYNNSYENHSTLFPDTAFNLCIYQYLEIKSIYSPTHLCTITNKIFFMT